MSVRRLRIWAPVIVLLVWAIIGGVLSCQWALLNVLGVATILAAVWVHSVELYSSSGGRRHVRS